jgi:DNA-binding NtrC family response regulator
MLLAGPVDIVVSDHQMPEMTGLEFLSLVRDRHPHVVRIMLTGHADVRMALQAINDGELYRFLEKPCSPTELRVTIHLARERLELERENRHLLDLVRSSPELMARVRLEELTRSSQVTLQPVACRH